MYINSFVQGRFLYTNIIFRSIFTPIFRCKIENMKAFIENLLPRIKQYSQSLDKAELFVDKPWVYMDERENQQKYIFRRNGELIISINGQVTMGKWEYIAPAQSLLIDRVTDKILLNQAFVDPAVMLLRMDGSKNEVMPLVNELLVPDLNIVGYLDQLEKKEQARPQLLPTGNIRTYKLDEGRYLQVSFTMNGNIFNDLKEGMNVYFDNQSVSDSLLITENKKVMFAIKDSKIEKLSIKKSFQTDGGELEIFVRVNYDLNEGDLVFKHGKPAPDGKYRFGFLRSIIVKDGKIAKVPFI